MSRTAAIPPRTARPKAACAALAALLLLAGGCRSEEPREVDLRAPGPAAMPRPPAVGDDVHGRNVQALVSSDFEARARAARLLVAAGDAAVPALGRAGDLPVPVAGGLEVSATRTVLRSILQRSDDARLERHLDAPWPNVRRSAAEELGRRERWAAIPGLIERLEDPDPTVRAASVTALRRMTNRFLGYDPHDGAGGRRAAAGRWRAWWAEEGRAPRRDAPGSRRT